MPSDCASIRSQLPELASGVHIARPAVRAHVEGCLQCQADLVQYRKLLRALRSLRHDVLEPAPGLLPDILSFIEAAGERHAIRSLLTGRRVAYIGGIAAATAAGAAGALVLASRNRSRQRVPARRFPLAS